NVPLDAEIVIRDRREDVIDLSEQRLFIDGAYVGQRRASPEKCLHDRQRCRDADLETGSLVRPLFAQSAECCVGLSCRRRVPERSELDVLCLCVWLERVCWIGHAVEVAFSRSHHPFRLLDDATLPRCPG